MSMKVKTQENERSDAQIHLLASKYCTQIRNICDGPRDKHDVSNLFSNNIKLKINLI